MWVYYYHGLEIESVLNYFMDSIFGEIEAIEHVMNLANPHNPNVDLVKIRQALIAHQSIIVETSGPGKCLPRGNNVIIEGSCRLDLCRAFQSGSRGGS